MLTCTTITVYNMTNFGPPTEQQRTFKTPGSMQEILTNKGSDLPAQTYKRKKLPGCTVSKPVTSNKFKLITSRVISAHDMYESKIFTSNEHELNYFQNYHKAVIVERPSAIMATLVFTKTTKTALNTQSSPLIQTCKTKMARVKYI